MTRDVAPPERVFAGTVGKGHGLDGSFYVVAAVPALLTKGVQLWVEGEAEPRKVERRAGTDAKPILRLSGSSDRNAADLLRGKGLEASNADAPPLDEDEYWAHELVGCSVAAADGRALGDVAELMALPSCEVLVVRGVEAVGELLIPLVKDAIVEIDPDGRTITVDAEFLAIDGDHA